MNEVVYCKCDVHSTNSEYFKNKFSEAAKPLIRFLADNCNPHMQVIVNSTNAELMSGEVSFNTEEFIRD